MSTGGRLLPYLPRLLLEWDGADRGRFHKRVEGTMAFVDISGFTAMSERLASQGKEGAEEVAEIINSIFARLLAVAYENGGSLLKFGGDALLLFFSGPEHPLRACHAASWMRRRLREIGRVRTSVGVSQLRMHVGVHSGEFDFFVLGSVFHDLMIVGASATETVAMESAATAGEIVVSDSTVSHLPPRVLGDVREGGRLLVRTPSPPLVAPDASRAPDGDPSAFIPPRLRSLLAGDVEPEHRRVGIAFVRFEGVDELIERGGPDAALEPLDELMQAVQVATERNLVTYIDNDVEHDGGKFMLAAGAPYTSEHDGEQLLRAVRQILDSHPGLRLRAGVNQGHAFAGPIGPPYRRKYSVMGDVVNLAARLMAKAPEGSILSSPEVLAGTRAVFETRQLEPFRVKGKAEPVTAFDVGAIARNRRDRGAERAALVGRDVEMAALLAALTDAEHGAGSLVELVADPGMGKSKLVEELAWQSEDDVFLSVASEEYEASTPYYLLQRLLRSVLDIERASTGRDAGKVLRSRIEDLAPDVLPWLPLVALAVDADVGTTPEVEHLDESFKQAQLNRASIQVLEAALPSPTVIVLEDLHWVDDASFQLLRTLVREVHRRPWLVIGTRRAEAGSLADVAGAATVLELGPLPDEATNELIRSTAGDVPFKPHELARLSERAGGNPLFIQQLVLGIRADIGELPATVEGLIGARIDRLPPEGRALLRHAAVLGVTFETDLLRALMDDPVAAVDETISSLLAEFLVSQSAGSWKFRHALIRDVAYEALPFRRRRALHARVAEVLEDRFGVDVEEHAEALSLHFHLARVFDRSWRYSVLAGDRARDRFASVAAAEFYARALEDARRADGIEEAELLRVNEALGDVSERIGSYERASAAYRGARKLAGGRGAPPRLFLKEGVLRLRMGRYTDALRWYSRGLNAGDLAATASAADLVELMVAYAGVRYYQGRYADCIEWCKRAVPEAINVGDMSGLAHAYLLLHLAYTHLGAQERAAYRGLALPLFEDLGDFTRQGYVLNNLGIEAYYDGEWDRAREFYDRGRRALEEAGGVVDAADVSYNVAEILSDQGRLDEAEQLSREILDTYRAADYPVGQALAIGNLGRIASRGGRLDEAARLLNEAVERFRTLGDDRYGLECEFRIAEAAVFAGEHERALELIADLKPRLGRLGNVPALLVLTDRLRGYALAQAGESELAAEALERAERTAREAKIPYELALTLEAKSRVTHVGVEKDEWREEAAAIFDRLGVVATPDVPLPSVAV